MDEHGALAGMTGERFDQLKRQGQVGLTTCLSFIEQLREQIVDLEHQLTATPVEALVKAAVAQAQAEGVVNCAEYQIDYAADDGIARPALVTVQFKGCPSPLELKHQAEVERDAALSRLEDAHKLLVGAAAHCAGTLMGEQISALLGGSSVPKVDCSHCEGKGTLSTHEGLDVRQCGACQGKGCSSREPHQTTALTVWYGAMPESNGKTNWTAILLPKGHRVADATGFTIETSEYPDRVRYEADWMRWLIGELPEEPDILDYDANLHSDYVYPAVEHPIQIPKRLPVRMPQGRNLSKGYAQAWNDCVTEVERLNGLLVEVVTQAAPSNEEKA